MKTKPRRMTLHDSPWLCHLHVTKETPPSMRYDGGDVKAWQRRLRRQFRQLLGRMPARRPALNVRSMWQREHELGSIEKIAFTSEPFMDVPAYVCLPAGAEPPYTFMICLQGHGSGMHDSIKMDRDETKGIELEGDRDFALGCMRQGIAALCIEMRGFGYLEERRQERRCGNRCHDLDLQARLLGRTLPGERVYDVDRGIDYLAARGDVDMKRLGLMGISGGGMITICAAAVLSRIRFAAPIAHFCAYREGLMSIHHCGCCYVPGAYQYAEMADVMGLFAPKPVVVVTGKSDQSKPIAAVRRAFRDLKRIYRAAGAQGRCHLIVGDGGHRHYAAKAWPRMLDEIARLASASGTIRR